MRNNIASFEKTSHNRVKIMEKMNTEFICALNFAQNITLLLLVFSKEAISFLIYLLADKVTSWILKFHKIIYLHTFPKSQSLFHFEKQTH